MNAEIIAVGSELLTPARVDTNSLWLTGQLNGVGVEVVTKVIVGDDRARLSEIVSASLSRSEIVLLTGGLGPTEDDVTRDAVAQALHRPQHFRQDLCDEIAARFARMNRPMAEINKRQAYLIEGAEALPNPRGTAPGQWIELDKSKGIALLPGPPPELKPMFTAEVLPRLKRALPPLNIATLQFRVAGIGESDLDQLIGPVYTQYTNPVTTVLSAPGDVQVHLRARNTTQQEAQALVDEVGARIRELLGVKIYSEDGVDLETAVGRLLRGKGATLSVAESCTGGMLGARISSVEGSSDYFCGGFLTYTDEMKTSLVGVPKEMLAEHTAVSEPVAAAMADGVRARTASTFALSITGYAGPEGGAEENPVGTVFIGLARDGSTVARRFRFLGERERIRSLASTTALDWLRRTLLG